MSKATEVGPKREVNLARSGKLQLELDIVMKCKYWNAIIIEIGE